MPDPIQRIPAPEPLPRPTPEHQRKITRGKVFEIVTVMTLIVLGTAFLYWRSQRQANAPDAAASVAASKHAMEADGASAVGSTTLLGRQFWSYRKLLTGFAAHVDLVGERDEAPLETAILWLTPQPGAGPQPAEALQAAVDSVAITAWELVRSSALAFEKASKTMEFISDAPRPHDKGVGASDNGWKVTYITYRSYDDAGAPQPVLCVILQRLSAGEDETLAVFNRTLHEALHAGRDIKTALGQAPAAPVAAASSASL